MLADTLRRLADLRLKDEDGNMRCSRRRLDLDADAPRLTATRYIALTKGTSMLRRLPRFGPIAALAIGLAFPSFKTAMTGDLNLRRHSHGQSQPSNVPHPM